MATGEQVGKIFSNFLGGYQAGQDRKRRRKLDALEEMRLLEEQRQIEQGRELARNFADVAHPVEPVPVADLVTPPQDFLGGAAERSSSRLRHAQEGIFYSPQTTDLMRRQVMGGLGIKSEEQKKAEAEKAAREESLKSLDTIDNFLHAKGGRELTYDEKLDLRKFITHLPDKTVQDDARLTYAGLLKDERDVPESDYQKKLKFKLEAGVPESEARKQLEMEARGEHPQKEPEITLSAEELRRVEEETLKAKNEGESGASFAVKKEIALAKKKQLAASEKARPPATMGDLRQADRAADRSVAQPQPAPVQNPDIDPDIVAAIRAGNKSYNEAKAKYKAQLQAGEITDHEFQDLLRHADAAFPRGK